MPGFDVPEDIFKGSTYHNKICPCCNLLLRDPVRLTCGHCLCKSCADETLNSNPRCPKCKKEFHDQKQVYFPDNIIQGEINNLTVICQHSRAGCSWEGKFEEYEKHRKVCRFKTDLIPPEKLFFSGYGDEQKELTQPDTQSFPDHIIGKEMKSLVTFSEMGCNSEGKLHSYTVKAPFKMSGISVQQIIFKGVDKETFACHICPECKLVLRDAVQPVCGHRICQSCADEILARETSPCCPECGENFDDEDGAYYFPDRFVRKEIKNLVTICPFSEMGCSWEGKFEEYQQHVEVCKFAMLDCKHCGEKVRGDQIEKHTTSCPCAPKRCPLAMIGCSKNLLMKQSDLQNHLQMSEESHLALLVSKVTSLEKLIKEQPHNTGQSLEKRAKPSRVQHDFMKQDGLNPRHSMAATGQQLDSGLNEGDVNNSMYSTKYSLQIKGTNSVQDMIQKLMQEEMKQIQQTLVAELQSKDDEIASLKAMVNKLEKTMRSKNAELEDRDFRLSLIENSNHDGSMIWKIPQFSQRKADAENGKYTSIFSLPFYSGWYGYKMCLRLYIMGDGIGKGTHLSLFFVVMRGEFDNILQWPFTHKVTFKLINQVGRRDIVDTFQPDPMSSAFRKPKSDMNIASGCPRFVSHTELERGGFIVDDTIFIKCVIDTSTICHPAT